MHTAMISSHTAASKLGKGELQHPARRNHLKTLGLRRHQTRQTHMRHGHALGTPGRTGGVDHIRRMLSNQFGRAFSVGHVRAVQTGEFLDQGRIVEDENRNAGRPAAVVLARRMPGR